MICTVLLALGWEFGCCGARGSGLIVHCRGLLTKVRFARPASMPRLLLLGIGLDQGSVMISLDLFQTCVYMISDTMEGLE